MKDKMINITEKEYKDFIRLQDMGNRINVLRQILEYRGDQTDKITLITSNLPMNHKRFIDRYEDRVSSRLNEMCNYFEIKGKDRRKL